MRILIAGLGSIGRRHFRNLLALGERDITLLRTHKSTLPDDELKGFPEETDLVRALSAGPDAIIVSNPTALHLDVAIPGAESGAHLLLEKPVSHNLDGIAELRDAVRVSGSRVLVGFHFRHHPGLEKIETLMKDGAIGRPLSAHAHWGEYLPEWHPWEDYRKSYSARADLGGGVVLTLSHPLDYLRWLLGEVESLWAFTAKNSDLDLEVEDTAEIGLRFDSGVIGSLYLDYNQRPPAHTLSIIGTEGTLKWDNLDGSVVLYRSKTESWDRYSMPAGFGRNDIFLAEMRHFLAVVKGEENPICDLEDGIRALELALAVHESDRTGKLISIEKGK